MGSCVMGCHVIGCLSLDQSLPDNTGPTCPLFPCSRVHNA